VGEDEDEVEYVAKELATDNGTAWPTEKEFSPVVRLVRNRFMDRARVIIAALDRHRAGKTAADEVDQEPSQAQASTEDPGKIEIKVGQVVMYRPPGERRRVLCRVTKIEGGQAFIVPIPINDIGWVDLENTDEPPTNQSVKQ